LARMQSHAGPVDRVGEGTRRSGKMERRGAAGRKDGSRVASNKLVSRFPCNDPS
jgi:hypothetical protein